MLKNNRFSKNKMFVRVVSISLWVISKTGILNIKTSRVSTIKISIMVFMMLSYVSLVAQEPVNLEQLKQKISLNEVLKLASQNSLDAFKSKRKYGVSYWQFRSFKSSLLPKINFETRPFTFNRALVKRYDSEQNVDVFRLQQNLSSYANVSLTQDIRSTGTSLFINSSFDRIVNSGTSEIENYSATPIRIGLIQPIMAYNRFKWEKKTAPLQYQKAKQEFIYEQQTINLKTIDFFFNWALASKKVEIAQENKTSAEKLFKIGKKRYDIGAIERDDLLNLEMDVYNANTNLTQNQQSLQKAEAALKLYLRDVLPSNTIPELPDLITNIQIDINEATQYAKANNPELIDLKLRQVEALRDLDKAIKDNRFDLSITASYGLNQQANTFRDAYSNLLNQQMVSVNFSIPILDWGERKGNIKTARMNKDVAEIELQQDEDKFKQDITQKVIDFNLQKDLVEGALRTSEIARESYKITEKRFLLGNLDYLRLTASRQAWQSATERYIQSLLNYWKLYYQVQQLTLYDFINNRTIEQNFDIILND
ncbi:TolC family protein [Polaribacter batillariae]|uniref:TolC family protein n=1 Tax=Polaribacter batillariae TaxID=2808900 RepID=A0ABX7SWB4_9FLAO|nr:TolC family protein [Polaribacter batillariae]QTD38542.1 TolC family protein [Polaribacter batillariae]